jgi:hypothetical protein
MAMAKSPSALPAFSFNWVGGDIHGLSNLAGRLYGFAAATEGPVSALTNATDRLIADSNETSWKGAAADKFKTAVSRDMTDINWLSGHANVIGDIVDELAVNLAKIESTLERQLENAAKNAGVTISSSGEFQIPNNCIPMKRNSFLLMTNSLPGKAHELANAARKAAARKLVPEYKALSNGLANYRDNHSNLLSTAQMNDLKSKISGLNSSFTTADKPLHSHTYNDQEKGRMKDAVAVGVAIPTAVVGGIIGTVIEPGGGTIAGIGIGGFVGQELGQMVGSIFD